MLNIMIVDDEVAIRQGLFRVVSDIFDVSTIKTCENAKEAINQLEDINILITDIKMPNMDGLEFSKRVHEKYPNIKIIISTGYPNFEYAREAIKYNVVEFLVKPTDPNDLLKAIDKARDFIYENEKNMNKDYFHKIDLLFYDLIYGEVSNVYEKLEALKIKNENFLVSLVSTEKEEDIANVKEYLSESLEKVYFTHKSDKEFYLISNKNSNEILQNLIDETIITEEYIINIGSSTCFDDISYIKKASVEADRALRFAFYDENKRLIKFENIPQTKEYVLEQSIKYLDLLKKSIEVYDVSLSQTNLDNLFGYVKKEKINYMEINKICIIIYNFCISILYNYSIVSSFEKTKTVDLEQILKSDNIDEIKGNLSEFIKDVIIFIGQNPTYMDNIINTIKTYIEINYKNNITLDSLAKKAHFSPSYLSKFFKKEVGENISTYIQNIRIDKAKVLLKTTTLKTYEIAEAVGIEDPVYFSRIFKKVTGVKPKDYREKM